MTILIFRKYPVIEGFIQKGKNYIENCNPFIAPGPVSLTDEFWSRFSQHWDKISTNGLRYCVPAVFAYLGKLFTFSGIGRPCDDQLVASG